MFVKLFLNSKSWECLSYVHLLNDAKIFKKTSCLKDAVSFLLLSHNCEEPGTSCLYLIQTDRKGFAGQFYLFP